MFTAARSPSHNAQERPDPGAAEGQAGLTQPGSNGRGYKPRDNHAQDQRITLQHRLPSPARRFTNAKTPNPPKSPSGEVLLTDGRAGMMRVCQTASPELVGTRRTG